MSEPSKFPRCPECGGEVRMLSAPGRTREFKRGVLLSIPTEFEIPTCSQCGEEMMIPEVSEPLDALLEQQYRARMIHETRICVRVLQERHGASQQDIEDACCITRSYLSHLLAGRKDPSRTLVQLLKSFALAPITFEHALRATTVDHYMSELLAMEPPKSTAFRVYCSKQAQKTYEANDWSEDTHVSGKLCA